MSELLLKQTTQTIPLNNDGILRVKKAQPLKFLQFVVLLAMGTLNVLTIKIASPFLKEFFVVQAILVFISFIKSLKTNHISK